MNTKLTKLTKNYLEEPAAKSFFQELSDKSGFLICLRVLRELRVPLLLASL
jgi:hypothetical protein